MRVLMVSKLDARASYGGSNRAYHLGRHLAEKVELLQVGPDCASVDYARARSTGSRALGPLARHVAHALRDFAPDVVFALEGRAALVCRWLVRPPTARLVVGVDSSPAYEWREYLRGAELPRARCLARYALSRLVERTILAGGAPIVAVSTFLRDLLTAWYGVRPERIHVVPNGAPHEMLARPASPPPSPYAADGAAATALLVAPRNFHSNVAAVRLAHRVAGRLARTDPGVRLVVVGGGPVLGTSPNLRYAGHVPDVVPYIDFADVCLLPYPSCAVAGGARLKALEYLARGRPVLTTPEGIRGVDHVRDGVEVAVAPPDADALATELSRLIRDGGRRRALGAAGRRLVAARHDWRALAGDLLAVLEGRA